MKFFSILFSIFFIISSHPHISSSEETTPRKWPCQRSLSIPLPNEEVHRFDNDSLLHKGLIYPPNLYWHDENTTYGCACEIRSCVRKCCDNGQVLSGQKLPICLSNNGSIPELVPEEHQLAEEIRNISKVSDRFGVVMNRLCPNKAYKLEPDMFDEDKFVLQADGTLKTSEEHFEQSRFCMDFDEDLTKITVLVCHEPVAEAVTAETTIYPIGIIISIPFLLATLVVYAIIPELKNLYGMTLMCYVASLVGAYFFLTGGRLVDHGQPLCVAIGFVIHFSFLASFFWLNVMCFDIWWTFGGFRSLQGSVKQRERKKFIIYSAYAWGCPLFMTGICLIMDFVPSVPSNWIRPEFGVFGCWIHSDAALGLYFYGPMGLTVICNIFLFISTAMKIVQHKKDTAHHLKGMDSRRHDDHKQWFNLYLKLFIVMGINWSMEIVSWVFKKNSPSAVWILTDLANALQGLIIFIIFVWKDKIKRLLLKRLGFRDRNFKSGNSSRSAYHSSTSRTTCTTATVLAPLHDKNKNYSERTKNVTDESDCV